MKTMTTKMFALPVIMGAMFIAIGGQQAKAADTTTTLTINNFTSVSATAGMSMTPNLSEIQSGTKTSNGAVTLTVTTNNETGCNVTVVAGAGDDRDTKISPDDIQIKSATSGTDAGFTSFAAAPTSATELWNTDSPVPDGTEVVLDVKFLNLKLYPTSPGGASKDYTNTLTFTATANS